MSANIIIISEISKKYSKVVDFEDAAVVDFATLLHIVIISTVLSDFQFAGGKRLDVARATKRKRRLFAYIGLDVINHFFRVFTAEDIFITVLHANKKAI